MHRNDQVYCSTSCRESANRKRNKTHLKTYSRNWYRKHKEKSKKYHQSYLKKPGVKKKRADSARERVYGKGASEHLSIQMKLQHNRCAVCREPLPNPCIDHNHRTGQLRGAVCHGCNTGIGHIEKPGFLKKVTTYLKRWRTCSIQKKA